MPENDRIAELEREVDRLKAESAEKTRCLMRMAERLQVAANEEAKVPGLERMLAESKGEYERAHDVLKVFARRLGGGVIIARDELLAAQDDYVDIWTNDENGSVHVVGYDPLDAEYEL